MKHLTFILMCCLALSSQAAIYKWVDKQGNTHFSDSPEQPNAKKIKLLPVQTYTAPTQQVEHVNVEAADGKKELKYSVLEIIQPKDQATIRNNQGFIAVSVKLKPALLEGDKLQLMLDGKPYGQAQTATTFALNGLNRGSHTIAIKLVSKSDATPMQSKSITVYLHRPRVIR